MNKVILYIRDTFELSGFTRQTQQVSTELYDPDATFISSGVKAGDYIENRDELGDFLEAKITSVSSETVLVLSETIYGQGAQDINYRIYRGFNQVDLFEDETISVTSKIQDIRDISKVFTDFSQSFTLPASKKNNKLFKHFYNYFISEGAFDARKKVDAILEINYIPFRRGKIFLNGVKMKNNKAYAYNVTFFGNTVTLTDLFGDDEISQLDLSAFNHDYGNSEVQTGLTTGYFSESIIYPLITHTQRLYFNSDDNHSATTLDGDLSCHLNNSHSIKVALRYNQLKPALKVKDIISAIESKYQINFVDSDFISTTPMSNLYMWLSRTKGVLGGTEGAEDKIRVLGSWVHVDHDTLVSISSSGEELTLQSMDTEVEDVQMELTITPTPSYTSTQYDVEIYRDGILVSNSNNNVGTSNTELFDRVDNMEGSVFKFIVKTSGGAFEFTPTLFIGGDDGTGYIEEEDLDCGGAISVQNEVIISEEIPKIKVMDFISGILKMFNLTVYYIDDESDVNYGKIRMIPLDDFYDDSPSIFDITEYVDSSEHDVESTIPFSEVEFEYQEPKTLLMKQHKESFNHIFGDEEFKPTNVDRGKPYKVKVPFEHLKFERLFDEDDNSMTSIQWGYSAGDNFKPDASDDDAGGQPSANYDPVLTKPVLFYGIRITGLTADNGINYNTGGSNVELLNYWKPSNTNENGTSTTAPAFTLNFDNEVDEWNLTDYNGTTNSLFKKFYQTYIEDAFNAKKRIFKLTAHLPNSVLLNYKLNDRFQIGDKVFTINSIDTNLKTGESKLELLNVL